MSEREEEGALTSGRPRPAVGTRSAKQRRIRPDPRRRMDRYSGGDGSAPLRRRSAGRGRRKAPVAAVGARWLRVGALGGALETEIPRADLAVHPHRGSGGEARKGGWSRGEVKGGGGCSGGARWPVAGRVTVLENFGGGVGVAEGSARKGGRRDLCHGCTPVGGSGGDAAASRLGFPPSLFLQNFLLGSLVVDPVVGRGGVAMGSVVFRCGVPRDSGRRNRWVYSDFAGVLSATW
ncbi:proline-rich receptor-like protein kinase PERK9 [Iris pallida]|uniref:Proline-rich receptor-like protein kinase PERK9 n=1 Tax=Iris pallida TaxID=29817 RepID=A0AAX6DKP5_IRIPA|nr:proline-rich receptor-like protein kinase PERK9 [Iris pallida]